MKVLSELQEHILEVTVTDDGHEEMDCRMNKKKNALIYFHIVVVLFYDVLQHNRILIKETLQTIRIIVFTE